ncbi:MAG: rhamnogalacturonan endolyase, partial [Chthoniobacter sp.]|nr:rhamnogalacturonan endolyase [Chthoniobacter sp.]
MNLVPPGLIRSALIALAFAAPGLRAAGAVPAVIKPNVNAPVIVTDNGDNWTMENGLVKATITKRNSRMTSLVYHGVEIMGPGGIWEQTPPGQATQTLTIDPAKNGGERGEVAMKGVDGKMDIEIRYVLERGVSGFYTYAEYTHGADYPAAGFGENRFILQMKPTFDWLSVDADRNMPMCSNDDLSKGVVVHAKEQRILSTGIYKNSVEHKYSYSGEMYRLPAYGWSSIKDHIGIYFIHPSTEYIAGGATRLDLVCHMGATLLAYWTSGHYAGGACCSIPAGESWKKVVGPIFVYCNALANPKDASKAELDTLAGTAGNPTVPATWHDNAMALWQDALGKAKTVKAGWPFDWVNGVDYPHKDQRSTVTGQLALNDPQAPTTKLPHLTVGLSHPDYTGNGSAFAQRSGNGDLVTWEHDGNYYQFWADGAEDGKFSIPSVRPGTYTMHAFADGVLGEFAKTDITVEAGKALDLGKVEWKPVRQGRQVWEIGYPTRYGDKFLKGDGANYWLWGWCLRYPLLFPKDITYTIGKSDYHKDWFFEQVPHGESTAWLNPAAKDPANQRFGWVKAESLEQYPQKDERGPWRVYGHGRATTWTIKFNLNKLERGQAALRVALAGSDGNGLEVGVNGKSVGTIQTISTNALRYNT